MNTTITILDGYTDEPSCLGVPPYIAPLPRYIFGAINSADPGLRVNYLTIDEYRNGMNVKIKADAATKDKLKLLNGSELLIIIAGAVVPGKYLSGIPISYREAITIAKQFKGTCIIGGACAKFGFGTRGKLKEKERLDELLDFVCLGDLDAFVYDYLTNDTLHPRTRSELECQHWSRIGAQLVTQHPNYPERLHIELEAGRGCVRYFSGGCSFCSEPETGMPIFRTPEDISEEVKQLSDLGITHFRIGALSCIFSYHAYGIGETQTPRPNPEMVAKLLYGIRSSAPHLKVLHLDNANPAVMAAHVPETKAILKTITQTCTGGNVLSFGIESADPAVIKKNNLNTNPEEVEQMVKLVNKYGAFKSETGLPMVLPGLNFVYGLTAESPETFTLNFEFLRSLLEQKLMLRRINLRQVIDMKHKDIKHNTGTRKGHKHNFKKYHREFVNHKKKVREKIDRPMLERILPKRTLLNNVLTETYSGKTTFGRQLGTYPILVGIPYNLPLNTFFNIAITEHGFRSVTGFNSPFFINKASLSALEALPGIGARRAARMINARPFTTLAGLHKILDDPGIIRDYEKYLTFELENP